MPTIQPRGYRSWQQVAGYFDGDGSPKVHVGVFAITITVSWSDQDRALLEHISEFLAKSGIVARLGKFSRGESLYHELDVGESGGNALLALKGMLPFLDKKQTQVWAAIEYLESRITGNQFVRVLNAEVRAKRRSSPIISAHLPFRKNDALQFAKSSQRFGRSRAMTGEDLADARLFRKAFGLTYSDLSEVYDLPESTVYYSFKRYL